MKVPLFAVDAHLQLCSRKGGPWVGGLPPCLLAGTGTNDSGRQKRLVWRS